MEEESRSERRARHRGAPAKSEDVNAKPRGRRALTAPEAKEPIRTNEVRNPKPAVRDQFSELAKPDSDGLDNMRAATCASLAIVVAVLLALIHPPTSGQFQITPLGVILPLLILGVGGWFMWRGRQT